MNNSCIQIDMKNNKVKEVERIKFARSNVACTIYEGKIVVSGGHVVGNFWATKTAEVYDYMANELSNMPSFVKLIGTNFNKKLFAIIYWKV